MDLMVTATIIQGHCIHAFASLDISGTVLLPYARTLMNAFWVPTIASGQPNASTHQVLITVSALPSWAGPSMADPATTLMSASTQMSATHAPRALITLGDLNAFATQDGEDEGNILYVLTLMSVQELTSKDSFLFPLFACLIIKNNYSFYNVYISKCLITQFIIRTIILLSFVFLSFFTLFIITTLDELEGT